MVNYFLLSVLRISARFKILFRFYHKVFFVLGKSVTLVLCLKTKTLSLVSFKRFCYFVQGSLKRGSFCGVCELRQFGSGAFFSSFVCFLFGFFIVRCSFEILASGYLLLWSFLIIWILWIICFLSQMIPLYKIYIVLGSNFLLDNCILYIGLTCQ